MAAFPGKNGKIAFGSDRETCQNGCEHTLFTINPDGSELTSLHTPTADSPAWSSDGTRLAFERGPFSVSDIYVREPDGTLIQLTTGPDGEPAWSPDGTKIAFTRVVPRAGPGNFRSDEIHVMDEDGSNVTRLTDSVADGLGFDASEPAWSPDGSRIAFTRVIRGGLEIDTEIYVMNADGTEVSRLTHNFTPNNVIGDQSDFGPDWSPDGGRIAFSGRHDNNSDIYTIRPDGSQLTRLTTDTGFDREPAWSPDGTKIAFINAFSDLLVMNADGTGTIDLARFGSQESHPSWQPIPNRPPDCSGVTPDPAELWPPNRHLRAVTLSGATDPDGDAVTLRVTGVTQDEPEGAEPDSQAGAVPHEVMLRAERDPKGDGRLYTVAFEVKDEHGASCTGEVTVTVPRHKR